MFLKYAGFPAKVAYVADRWGSFVSTTRGTSKGVGVIMPLRRAYAITACLCRRAYAITAYSKPRGVRACEEAF